MKKLLFLTMLLFFVSCGSDEKDEQTPVVKEISLSKTEVILDALSGKEDIQITNASGTITATSGDNNIATCEVKGNTLHIEAFLVGTTEVLVNNNNKTASCKVQVNETLPYLGHPVLSFGASMESVKGSIKGTVSSTGDGKFTEVEHITASDGISVAVNTNYQFVQDKLSIVTQTLVSSTLKTAGVILALSEHYLPIKQNPPYYYTYGLNGIQASLQAHESSHQFLITYTKN
jgi:hypothetical protein